MAGLRLEVMTEADRLRCAEGVRMRHKREAAAKLAAGRPACVHCTERPVGRPRNLCWTCYYTPGVRRKYQPRPPGRPASGVSRPDKRRSGFSVKPCRHCRTRPGWATRGLCKRCANDLAVRELYPPLADTGRRSDVGVNPAGSLPPEPTSAPPGTPEKMAVLEWRAEQGLALFHPRDARYEDDWRAA